MSSLLSLLFTITIIANLQEVKEERLKQERSKDNLQRAEDIHSNYFSYYNFLSIEAERISGMKADTCIWTVENILLRTL